jgi:hypothetical protein
LDIGEWELAVDLVAGPEGAEVAREDGDRLEFLSAVRHG